MWSVAVGADWSVAGGKGVISFPNAASTRIGVLLNSHTVDSDQFIEFTIPAVMTGASMVAGLLARYVDGSNFYWLRAEFDVAGVMALKISRTVGGVDTELGTLRPITGVTYSAGTVMRVRASCVGTKLSIKAWRSDQLEPKDWQFSVSDDSIRTAGLVGIRAWLVGGNTNSPVPALSFDNYKVTLPLFFGEISEWPSRWDVSGKDQWVPVDASGVLRRLGQGKKALRSPIYRNLSQYSPSAYWPLEDGSDSEYPSSAVSGAPRGSAIDVTYSAEDSLPGAATVAKLGSATSAMTLTNRPNSSSTAWCVIFYLKLDSLPASNTTFMRMSSTGRVTDWTFNISSTTYEWIGTDAAGATVVSQATTHGGEAPPTKWVAFQVYAKQNGGNVDLVVNWHAVGSDTFYSIVLGAITYAGAVRTLNQIRFVPSALSACIAHVAVAGRELPLVQNKFARASNGYLGEAPAERIKRLCTEEAVPSDVVPDSDDVQLLGRQKNESFLDLLDDAAAVGGGILYESRADLAVAYRNRNSIYNQTPLGISYSTGHVASPFEPVEDDSAIRNDVTVTREGGGSARVVVDTGPLSVSTPPSGVGVYDESVTLSLFTDVQAADQAGWRTRLGTIDEARYPRVSVDLTSSVWASSQKLARQVTALGPGDLVSISGLPDWLPAGPVTAVVQGYTMRLDAFAWDITWNATPGSAWTVAQADSNTRVDSDSSVLSAGVSSSATSLSVASDPIDLWTTDPADFPLSILVGGELMTVTAISGSTSPQTFTVTRSVNGIIKSQSAGAAVNVAEPAIVPL
ncbi:hypothetical protein ACQP2H_10560 [Micromonospora sp. CA-248260]|uniref:hypothetical protein n=1 Tax=Micromonospora sp. CA-248260 TaxID=3239962 RepID=UPI003D8F4AF5